LVCDINPLNGSACGASVDPVATLVGSEICVDCHQTEAKLWRSFAMALATDKPVLGDFNNKTFDYYSVQSPLFPLRQKSVSI